MFKRSLWHCLVILTALLMPTQASSMTVFDFDSIQSTSKKGAGGASVEAYMEGLYGSNLSVSQKTAAVRGPSIYNNADLDNSYLKIGKGKGGPPAIVINFDDDPIHSFSVDFKLLRKAKSFSILADGELINHQSLTKAQKKSGLSGHQNAYFFDKPVHSLRFVGLKKKSFAIDNLVVNIPFDLDDASEFGQAGGSSFTANVNGFSDSNGTDFDAPLDINQLTADVREPASLLLFGLGSLGLIFFRIARGCF